jgi:hypothetical protein
VAVDCVCKPSAIDVVRSFHALLTSCAPHGKPLRSSFPVYAGSLVMLLGIPIALGSWWGLLVIVAMMPGIWRLFDEEKFLASNLPGYAEYQKKCGIA